MFTGRDIDLVTTDTSLFTVGVGQEGSLHSIVFGNKTSTARTVTIKIKRSLTGTTKSLVVLTVPANDYKEWPKTAMEAGDEFIASAAVDSAITTSLSFYSVTATGVINVAFNPAGDYAAGTIYGIRDVVYFYHTTTSISGSYMSRVAGNIGNTPNISPTKWQKLADSGPAGTSGASSYIIDKGEWSGATAYVRHDSVTRKGAKYLALADNTNQIPSVDNANANWALLGNGATESLETLTSSTSVTVDSTAASNFYLESSHNGLITITGLPGTGKIKTITLIYKHVTSARSPTWASNIKWTDNIPPVTSTVANGVDIFTFFSYDNTNWYGSLGWWSNS